MKRKTKFKAGRYKLPVTLHYIDDRIYIEAPYNKQLTVEIKECFERRKWHGFEEPSIKMWSVPITQRNLFVLDFLEGKDPYKRFDVPTDDQVVRDYCSRYERPLYGHQFEMVAHGLARKHFIWAAEMGTGKTLAAIVLMELSDYHDWIWVGPKSALRAVALEMRKWNAQVIPEFHTYEGLKKLVKAGRETPRGLILDESSRCKTPTSQRSVAAKHVADAIREDHGLDSFIGLLSGSPAPKSPIDWWHQVEIACPGFLREGNIHVFKNRLAIIDQRERIEGGGIYPHLVTWRDDEAKCQVCGESRDAEIHDPLQMFDGHHQFQPGVNEVSKLYRRMNGLVLVKLKKDCLDLPDKIYDEVIVEPTAETIRAAKLIVASSKRAIEALTLLRELSDGFQYQDKVIGKIRCPLCQGSGKCTEYYDPDAPAFTADPEALSRGVRFIYDDDGFVVNEEPIEYERRVIDCTNCWGSGEVDRLERTVVELPCPKDDVLREQLDLHVDVGRLNIYAGFTGSIDRVIKIAHAMQWGAIRADGRGWQGFDHTGSQLPNKELLEIYDQGQSEYPRLAFVGQPGAAGMGLTLTASPTTFFFSNDFVGENRIQAEDRGHRIGMDRERGGRIVDVIHLETDRYILDNLKKKRNLQHLSMTGLKDVFK